MVRQILALAGCAIDGFITRCRRLLQIQHESLPQVFELAWRAGTSRLVMPPYESHGYRGRESVLHVLAESID